MLIEFDCESSRIVTVLVISIYLLGMIGLLYIVYNNRKAIVENKKKIF